MALSTVEQRRNALASLSRHRGPSAPETIDARRDLAAAKLAAYVERVVADAPPLTAEQRDRIAALLRPTAERIA